jgi:hypothetical protein
MKKKVRLTERDLSRIVSRVLNEQDMIKMVDKMNLPTKSMSQKQDEFAKFPCLSDFKEMVSPKGQKFKMGTDFWRDYHFYPNGRVLHKHDKTMAYFKCYDNQNIVISDDPKFPNAPDV